MLGMVAVPATITLESVRSPAAIQMTNSDPTPYGYTWSLLLFLKQMIGIRIGAWSGLPVEAVCVWIAVTYATAIIFEVVKLWQASEKPAKDAFLGLKSR